MTPRWTTLPLEPVGHHLSGGLYQRRTHLPKRKTVTLTFFRHRRHDAADENLYQDIDTHSAFDLKPQQGDVDRADKPAVAVWLRHPGASATASATLDITYASTCCSLHDECAVHAIVMGNRALITFSPNSMPIAHAARQGGQFDAPIRRYILFPYRN